MAVIGEPPLQLLKRFDKSATYFRRGKPILIENTRGEMDKPNTRPLERILKVKDRDFIDFIKQCFNWRPVLRPSA